jgi:hypothetical protein
MTRVSDEDDCPRMVTPGGSNTRLMHGFPVS